MNRLPSLALCALWVALICSLAVKRTQAQATPPAAQSTEQAQKPATPPVRQRRGGRRGRYLRSGACSNPAAWDDRVGCERPANQLNSGTV